MEIKKFILFLPAYFLVKCLAIFICSAAIAQEIKILPDWSGIWERYEGNGGMFDIATTQPPDGRAGNPGVRQFPPLTELWEKKYIQNLECLIQYQFVERLLDIQDYWLYQMFMSL